METMAETPTRELCILDQSGDTKIIWDPEKPDEVAQARETFDKLRKKGYLAYAVNRKGDKGEVLREFNPDVEKMILAPQMVGG